MKNKQAKMNILILTGVPTGTRSFFYEAKKESRGMPAFNNVFYRLLEDERVDKILIMLWQPTEEINIPKEYQNKIVVYSIKDGVNGLFDKIASVARAVRIGRKLVKKYDVQKIIGFGGLGGITAIIGKKVKIPDFRRLYGTFLINEINQPKWKIFLRHPLEYLCYRMSGKGLLITNDGTKGDKVFEKLGTPKLPFYFPLNGVDKDIIEKTEKPLIDLPKDFLVYVARLDPWKQQNLLIEALNILNKKGVDFPKTYIVGAVSDSNYLEDLQKKVEKYHLSHKIEFILGLPIRQAHYMLYHSKISFSLYHTSNLGNVFLESMQLGVPTIAINDTGSLNLIDSEAYYELKTNKIEKIADAIYHLLTNENERLKIKQKAMAFADCNLKPWKERAEMEIDMMLL
ncbi:glycosyltransferase [Capnocytophaga canis]|uniref:glycosyltransferase n=1 Tax=Capnocytophaga TaxID=1016 RepID=UPI0012FFC7ED|nr:glycosyltransferase [Capnocytophaga sp. H4358]